MSEQPNPGEGTGTGADETFTWADHPTGAAGSTESTESTESTGSEGDSGPTGQGWDAETGAKDESVGATAGAAAVQVLEQLRDAIDDLAERASPTVREYSARIAELAAFAADRTAPFLKRAGEATSEASGKLAEQSRRWAADIRASQGTTGETGAATETESPDAPPAWDSPEAVPSDSGEAAPDEHGTGMS